MNDTDTTTGAMIECETCEGTGERFLQDGDDIAIEDCRICDGRGEIDPHEAR